MTTPSEGQHWTEAMPHLLDRAAELLGIDRATAARHSAVVPGGFHVWAPGRGGAQLVMGFDGGALVRESCFSQAEMVQSFMQNHRNDAGPGRTMHAGSAVLVALDHLAQRAPRTISAQDPGEATLAAAGRGPFQQTTPEEITARLSASPVGTWTLLGIDRPHGPGHWYVVLVTPDGLTTIDPVANRTLAWSPVTEAVRWWTDGQPSTPPARVVVDVRTAAGRRVWTETAPALEPHARELLDWFAQQPTLRAGQGVWHSFWWAVVAAAGNDLRLAATDLTKPGIETLTWDVEDLLTYRAAEVRATNGVPREPVHFIDGVRWRPEVANAGRAVLRRRTVAEGDTGWLVTTRPADDGADLTLVPAHEVHRAAPWVTPFLSHPVGTLLEVRADGSRHEVARTLLADPAASGEQLLAAAEAIQAAYERGEKRLGLLPP